MENVNNVETDFRKWLAFSRLINASSTIKELEDAIDKKKSFKRIIITCTKEDSGPRQYNIQEAENPSILRVDDDSIIELKNYLVKTYQPCNPELSNTGYQTFGSSYNLTNNTKLAKHLYSKNKFRHALTYSFFTLLALQILIIPKFLMNVEFPLDNFLRYPISLLVFFTV